MTQPGFSIESAASVIARDTITKHIQTFAHVIKNDRIAGQSVVATYVDGLAASVSLVIQGRHASKEEIVEATVAKLRDAIERDLRHLGV